MVPIGVVPSRRMLFFHSRIDASEADRGSVAPRRVSRGPSLTAEPLFSPRRP